MTGYCDASLGNNPDNGKSIAGYSFMLVGEPLSFKPALHNVTAKSTLDAELISMVSASEEALYVSNMTAELGFGKLFESVPQFSEKHRSPTSSMKQHLQLSHETHRSTPLLLKGASQGRQNHHPPRGNTEATGKRVD